MTAVVLRGDAAHLPLPPESVDLIVTSPPYFGLRSYSDGGGHYDGQVGSEATRGEYLAALAACTREWVRVLKPSGSIFVNLGDKYAGSSTSGPPSSSSTLLGNGHRGGGPKIHNMPAFERTPVRTDALPKSLLGLPWRYALACMDDLGLILRRDIIWHKPNGLPESVTDRCRSSHEYLFHFTVRPRYFAAVDEIREPQLEPGRRGPDSGSPRRMAAGANQGFGLAGSFQRDYNPLGKLPGSVWSIPSAPLSVPASLGVDHFAAYPPELCRRIILGWSPPGVCTACGEGRRPVSSKATVPDHHSTQHRWRADEGAPPELGRRFAVFGRSEVTITGYACACTPYTDHPGTEGRERTGQGYARETGRDAHPHGGVGTLPRTGPWREYHLGDWAPPPTRPALVVDPFGGTGTTALVAAAYGRTGVTVDRSADYCRLARWRTRDPGERARVLGVPKPPPVPDGQGSLFDGEAV